MLAVGTAGLILADLTSFRVVSSARRCCSLCIIATVLAEDPEQPSQRPRTVYHAVVTPFAEFVKRLGWATAIAPVRGALQVRRPDGGRAHQQFWRRELELTKTEIGTFTKAAGFAGVALGGFLAGTLTPRLGMRRALVIFGILQASTNFLHVALAWYGKRTRWSARPSSSTTWPARWAPRRSWRSSSR